MLLRGMDPKPLIMDFCKPQCIYWKEKLERCESKLEVVIKTNPTKSCLYSMRDWVTCVEACVSNWRCKILGSTEGAQPAGRHSETIHKDFVNKIAIIENNNTI